jgi:hypothetical protein
MPDEIYPAQGARDAEQTVKERDVQSIVDEANAGFRNQEPEKPVREIIRAQIIP